jgi:hypothetical protein
MGIGNNRVGIGKHRLKRMRNIHITKIAVIVLIAILLPSLVCDAYSAWVQEHSVSVSVLCAIITIIRGIVMISDKIEERRREADFGLYKNLPAHLSRIKSKVTPGKKPYDWYILKTSPGVEEPPIEFLSRFYDFISKELNYFLNEKNFVPPSETEDEKKEWENAISEIVTFLRKLEDVCLSFITDDDKYDNYQALDEEKQKIISSIDNIHKQLENRKCNLAKLSRQNKKNNKI